MDNPIEFGIGFLAGRPNVCKIINNYYKDILNQIEMYEKKVNVTIFILYDLEYQFLDRSYFYDILPEVYENIKIKYITPEDIEEEKKILISRYGYLQEDIDMILGQGYAKARNSVLYFALKRHMDYLFFWDDDEYPLAIYRDSNDKISWRKQNNILEQLRVLERANVTNGYRCGFMAPIPNIKNNDIIIQEAFKTFLEAVNTDGISWDSYEDMLHSDGGISFANETIATDFYDAKEWTGTLYASTLGINLKQLDVIPAFYNPPESRGEDTFFNIYLKNKHTAKVLKVSSYHFHDSFLKYTDVMNGKYPTKLQKITSKDGKEIEKRFYNTVVGWTKYKPLYIYLTDRENYRKIIDECKEKLKVTIPIMNKLFSNYDFDCLLKDLEEYDKNVENHYREYLKTNEIWSKLKDNFLVVID